MTSTICEVLNHPEKVLCPNRFCVDGTEALSILLQRFAYPCRYEDDLQGPFKEAALTSLQEVFNKSMSEVRVAEEWLFGIL